MEMEEDEEGIAVPAFSLNQQRRIAEQEVDAILSEMEPKKRQKRKREDGHVDQLVDLANKLRSDYRRLGQCFGDESDLSIAQLSRMNESLVSMEGRMESGSD